jgi:hypothetical protein
MYRLSPDGTYSSVCDLDGARLSRCASRPSADGRDDSGATDDATHYHDYGERPGLLPFVHSGCKKKQMRKRGPKRTPYP